MNVINDTDTKQQATDETNQMTAKRYALSRHLERLLQNIKALEAIHHGINDCLINLDKDTYALLQEDKKKWFETDIEGKFFRIGRSYLSLDLAVESIKENVDRFYQVVWDDEASGLYDNIGLLTTESFLHQKAQDLR